MAAAVGYASQLAVDTNATPTAGRLDFQSESLQTNEVFIDTSGLRGTRARAIERVRQGNRHIQGSIRCQPTPAETAVLLPWALGGTPTGSPTVTYPLDDTVPSRYVMVDRVQKVFLYDTVKVDRLSIRGSEGMPLDFTLDLVGADETVSAAGNFPSLSLDVASSPWIFTDCTLSIAGNTYQAREANIEINNVLDKERFFNSQKVTAITALDRHITITTSLPYGDASAVYNTGAGGVAVVVTASNGTKTLTMTFVKVAFPRHSPTVPGRVEIMLPLSGQAYKSGSTLELVTTIG